MTVEEGISEIVKHCQKIVKGCFKGGTQDTFGKDAIESLLSLAKTIAQTDERHSSNLRSFGIGVSHDNSKKAEQSVGTAYKFANFSDRQLKGEAH